jgi:hypothetical protein
MSSGSLISNQSMSASIVSDVINLHRRSNYSIHMVYTGSPVGAVYVSVSIDGTNWVVLADSSTAVNGAGSTLFNIANAGYMMARAHYAFTSGTGTLNATYSLKDN